MMEKGIKYDIGKPRLGEMIKDFVKVSIPKEYIVQDELNGQCGSCRFKQDIKCLLFDKDTSYSEKTGAIKLKQCPF